eukprot:TRINITY_DN5536_c0_g1_i1.p1 TRINITY_DN5536_c0_g1~~TRINITY_DN5536_c0_g1_i1.p1  ORF type:complete len:271 (+),score=63.50 TRINITY_DN5536_c0_g1_i1:154-966(+)
MMMGYNSIDATQELEEIQETFTENVHPCQILHPGRSISLGLIKGCNGGYICTSNSGQAGSSGGPQLNQNAEAIGVAIGSYYDVPPHRKRPNLYTIENSDDLFNIKITLPETKNSISSKNFNIALSFQHPIVQQMMMRLDKPYTPPISDLLTKATIPYIRQTFPCGECFLIQLTDVGDPLWHLFQTHRVLIRRAYLMSYDAANGSGVIDAVFVPVHQHVDSDGVVQPPRGTRRSRILIEEITSQLLTKLDAHLKSDPKPTINAVMITLDWN